MRAMARVKMNSPITHQPVTKGPAVKRSNGLSRRNAMMENLYHDGEPPRKLLLKAWLRVLGTDSFLYSFNW